MRGREPALVVVFKRIFINDLESIRKFDDITLENYSRLSGPLDLPIEAHSRNVDERLLILVDALKPVTPPATLQLKQVVSSAMPQQASPRDSNLTAAIDVRETRSPTDVGSSPVGRDRAGTSIARKFSPIDIYVRDRNFEKNCLVCRATVQREVEYRLFDIFSRREYFKNNDVLKGLSQTCQVSCWLLLAYYAQC